MSTSAVFARGSRRRSMSSFDEARVSVISEDGVSVMSEGGEAEDSALRALRDEQAKLDDAWNKRKLLHRRQLARR